MINWKSKFDKIYCLHYLPQHNRVERITNELKRVGILDSGIFKWDLSFDSPFYNVIRKNINFSDQCVYKTDDTRYGQFKCSFQHYEIIKRSYAQGLDRILIIEDDMIFIKDLNMIQNIIENLPETNLVLLDKFTCFPREYASYVQNHEDINEYFWKFNNEVVLFSSGCYALDRIGMERFILSQELEFTPSDNVWNLTNQYISSLTKSVANINLARQKNYTVHNDMTFNEDIAYRFVNLRTDLYE